MATYEEDRKFTELFTPEIQKICGQVFIKPAPFQIDCHEATDLLVLEITPIKIACRVRRFEYYCKYRGQFTIRAKRPSGVKTELKKIEEGWCDYLFYGFSNPFNDGSGFMAWMIGNLNVFRYEWARVFKRVPDDGGPTIKFEYHTNPDNSSSFYAYYVESFPKNFIVAQEGFIYPLSNIGQLDDDWGDDIPF